MRRQNRRSALNRRCRGKKYELFLIHIVPRFMIKWNFLLCTSFYCHLSALWPLITLYFSNSTVIVGIFAPKHFWKTFWKKKLLEVTSRSLCWPCHFKMQTSFDLNTLKVYDFEAKGKQNAVVNRKMFADQQLQTLLDGWRCELNSKTTSRTIKLCLANWSRKLFWKVITLHEKASYVTLKSRKSRVKRSSWVSITLPKSSDLAPSDYHFFHMNCSSTPQNSWKVRN